MTTSPAGRGARQIAAERDAIEASIRDGTLLTAFAETARWWAGTEAFRWRDGAGWHSLTYGELRQQVQDLTLGLLALGFAAGEFAVIWSRNRPEPNIADMAVMHARGVPVSLYTTLAPEQAAYIAGHCEATLAIVEDRGFLARLEEVRPQLPHLRRVILVEGEAASGEDWLVPWDSVLALGRAQALRSPGLFDGTWRQVGPDDLATLVYTSGTTGPPKGVMITHHNVRYCAEAVFQVLPPAEFADEAGMRGISYLPMAHVTGRFTGHWLPMVHPMTVAFCPDGAQLFQVAAEVRPTLLTGVPRVWEKLEMGLRAGLAAVPDRARRQGAEAAIEAGRQLVRCRQRGEQPPAALSAMAGPGRLPARDHRGGADQPGGD
jgi:long-chain acyl-CoA synthetase